jgi:hypothetical protein
MRTILVLVSVLALVGCTNYYAIRATVDGTVAVEGTANGQTIPLLELSGQVGLLAQSRPPYLTYWITPASYLLKPLNEAQRVAIRKGHIVVIRGSEGRLSVEQVYSLPVRAQGASAASYAAPMPSYVVPPPPPPPSVRMAVPCAPAMPAAPMMTPFFQGGGSNPCANPSANPSANPAANPLANPVGFTANPCANPNPMAFGSPGNCDATACGAP